MSRDALKYLHDVLDSIAALELHLQAVSGFEEYQANQMVVDAVERRLSIIGEAMWKVEKLDPSLAIQHKQRIISLRHKLIHDYDLIDGPIIWAICKKDLPLLKTDVERILQA